MDLNKIVDELSQSFTCQITWYKELKALVQKILGKISLSRGNIACAADLFEQKQKLLTQIITERERIRPYIDTWQKNKQNASLSLSAATLDAILAEIESEIKEFLELEEQLKTCIEYTIRKKNPVE